MENVVMKCGHIANAMSNGKPCCVICAPKKEAFEVEESKPDIDSRQAKCNSCGKLVKSSWDLPYFKYKKDEEVDSYYCGCCGWN